MSACCHTKFVWSQADSQRRTRLTEACRIWICSKWIDAKSGEHRAVVREGSTRHRLRRKPLDEETFIFKTPALHLIEDFKIPRCYYYPRDEFHPSASFQGVGVDNDRLLSVIRFRLASCCRWVSSSKCGWKPSIEFTFIHIPRQGGWIYLHLPSGGEF